MEFGRSGGRARGLDIAAILLLSLIAITALCAAILSAVPIPGGVGFVEPGIMGLLLLSMGRQDAVSVALVDRSITFVSVIAIGVVVFLAVQVWQGRSSRGKPSAAEMCFWRRARCRKALRILPALRRHNVWRR